MTAFDDALALHKGGSLDEAAQLYERAIEAEPGHAAAIYHLSLLRAQQGRSEDALRLAHAAVAIDATPQALGHLGALLLVFERRSEAIAHLERALELDPNYAQAQNNLGSAFLSLGRIDEGLARYRRAVELAPGYADAHNNLGAALRALGRFEEAYEHVAIASAAKPNDLPALGDMLHILLELGRLDEAHAIAERAIAIEPRPSYFLSFGTVHRYSPDDPHLATMERLARDLDSLDIESRIVLHFALGKAYADTGDHRRSFEHLLTGNALKRSVIAYDEAGTLASFEAIPKTFTREVIATHQNLGDPSRVPVLILGMPRSGTTLIEQILAGHPSVHAAGELTFFHEELRVVFPERGEPLNARRLHMLGKLYADHLRTLAPNAERISDKMPANSRFVGLVNLALPNARIIYAQRDPIDNCLSCFSLLFEEGQEHTYDLAEIGRYYRSHAALMDHWRSVLPPGVMLDVQYEDVVADLETQARRIIAHVGLPWDDACLEFHRVKRPVKTASAAQVRKPIYSTSVGRWRPYADHLQPLFDALQIELPLD